MIEAAIFDMDGVMFDTEALALKGWQIVGQKYGYEITSDDISEVRGRIVSDAQKIFNRKYGDKFDFYKARAEKSEYVLSYIHKNGIPIKKGLIELLQFLNSNNFKVGIATSTQKDTTTLYLEKANISNCFDKIICGDMIERGKPNPDIYLKTCKELEVYPQNCIVLEDSSNGIVASHSAGCKTIFVPDLDRPSEDVINICFKKVNSLLDVIEILKSQTV